VLGPILGPGLRILFVGINPSLRSVEVGHHFARPGNRFWPTLHAAGFTPRRLRPDEDAELLEHGIGVTNIAARATRAADELADDELREGAVRLEEIVREHAPGLVAIVGLTAYRTAFGRRKATMGLQPETLAGRPVWVLPNPSGLNAHYKPADFARVYAEARVFADALADAAGDRGDRAFRPRSARRGRSPMSRAVRIGIQLPEVERRVDWPEYLAMARAAEAVGFDSIWVGDHLLYRGDGRPERGPWEAWTLLAALAAATERVRLGPLVACLGFHPPGLVARMAATVAEVSAGRFVLGVGAGWNEEEFAAFGLPFDRRVSRFEEAFAILRGLLAGERVTLDGRTGRSTTRCCSPPRPIARR
jgi:TDG/mug DNA glycosylase family protein